jgi:hypothetical protein
MKIKYRIKVERSRWYYYQKKVLPEDIDYKSTLTITIENPTKVKNTKKKWIFLCSGFEIIEKECQGKWNKRFLIEPTIDGVTIETLPGFYFVK